MTDIPSQILVVSKPNTSLPMCAQYATELDPFNPEFQLLYLACWISLLFTPGNLDCLNQMLSLSRERENGYFSHYIICHEIGECYSAPYGLQKLNNVRYVFSCSNVGRNRKKYHQKVRKYTIPTK